MQNFGIYIIGDEILSGKRPDAYLTTAIEILKARGLSLSWAQYLGDDPAQITTVLKPVLQKMIFYSALVALQTRSAILEKESIVE